MRTLDIHETIYAQRRKEPGTDCNRGECRCYSTLKALGNSALELRIYCALNLVLKRPLMTRITHCFRAHKHHSINTINCPVIARLFAHL